MVVCGCSVLGTAAESEVAEEFGGKSVCWCSPAKRISKLRMGNA